MPDILKWLGGTTAVVIFVVGYLLTHLDQAAHLASLIFRVGSRFKAGWEKRSVALDIEGKIEGATRPIEQQAPGALPHGMKIEWVEPSSKEAFIEKGRVVVRLDHHVNQDRNLVVATLAYLGHGLLPQARHYVQPRLMQCVDYTVGKSIFTSVGGAGATSYFYTTVLGPAIEREPRVQEDCALLNRLDEQGYFVPVLLREFQEMGQRAFPQLPDQGTWNESRDFAAFLDTIAQKEKAEDVELTFDGRHVRVAVILFLKQETLDKWGLQAHERRLAERILHGASRIVLAGWSERNVQAAITVAKRARALGLISTANQYRHLLPVRGGKPEPGICIVCEPSGPGVAAELADPGALVRAALDKHVPEARDGRIQIVRIAREPGVRSKVAVQTLEYGLDPVGACIGPEASRLRAIQEELGGERVHIMRYEDGSEQFIMDSLYPLPPSAIRLISMDVERREAIVHVTSEAAGVAIGKGGVNARLARELTGYDISIVPIESD